MKSASIRCFLALLVNISSKFNQETFPWSFNQKSDLARGTPLRNIPHQHSQQAARRAPMRRNKKSRGPSRRGRAIKRPQACCKTVARKISRPGSNGIVVPLGTVVHTEEVSGRSLAKGPSPKLAHHIVMSGKRKLVGCATNRHAAVTSPAPRAVRGAMKRSTRDESRDAERGSEQSSRQSQSQSRCRPQSGPHPSPTA